MQQKCGGQNNAINDRVNYNQNICSVVPDQNIYDFFEYELNKYSHMNNFRSGTISRSAFIWS